MFTVGNWRGNWLKKIVWMREFDGNFVVDGIVIGSWRM